MSVVMDGAKSMVIDTMHFTFSLLHSQALTIVQIQSKIKEL